MLTTSMPQLMSGTLISEPESGSVLGSVVQQAGALSADSRALQAAEGPQNHNFISSHKIPRGSKNSGFDELCKFGPPSWK